MCGERVHKREQGPSGDKGKRYSNTFVYNVGKIVMPAYEATKAMETES